MRLHIPALAALLAVIGAPAIGQPQAADLHGTWTAELHTGKVFLQVRTSPPPEWNRSSDSRGDWSMGHSLSVDELAGLPANDDQLTVTNVRFELRREAGTLSFEGAFRDGRGAGLFSFSPRAQYADEMRRLGYSEELPLWRRYQLAVQDIGPQYIAALRSEGFSNVPLETITRSKNHGVTLDYIKALKAEGFAQTSLEELVRTRDHGVTPAYIHDMRGAGFASATIEELMRAKDHGVSAAYVNDLSTRGYKSLPLPDVVRARDHGVTTEYLVDMIAIVKEATLQQIIRMRDHGVTPGFVNHARARGFTTTDPDELIRLRDRGLR